MSTTAAVIITALVVGGLSSRLWWPAPNPDAPLGRQPARCSTPHSDRAGFLIWVAALLVAALIVPTLTGGEDENPPTKTARQHAEEMRVTIPRPDDPDRTNLPRNGAGAEPFEPSEWQWPPTPGIPDHADRTCGPRGKRLLCSPVAPTTTTLPLGVQRA